MNQGAVFRLPNGPTPGPGPARARAPRAHTAISAHGEPLVWLSGGALVLSLAMIAALLGLILVEGFRTAWPVPIERLELHDGRILLGEVSRVEAFQPEPHWLDQLPPAAAEQARRQQAGGRQLRRRLLRTGNFELSGSHFQWVADVEVANRQTPADALVLERESWGRFYGTAAALIENGQVRASDPEQVWQQLEQRLPAVRARLEAQRRIERRPMGELNRRLNQARLALRQAQLDQRPAAEIEAARDQLAEVQRTVEHDFGQYQSQIAALEAENAPWALRMRTADGQEADLPLATLVRVVPSNRLSWLGKVGVYLDRWREFVLADPREANSEGGVFPALFGTVVMTLVMSLAVVPCGVLAALYLREYTRAGWVVSAVRIAVNNLAGVPSIVFGVFGLGFFCYVVGSAIDNNLFEANLPNPTFGKGGLLWASLTLALLTLPVVIVASEEALAAVPNSMREGSYACGASKTQTIWRIVLPRAAPGIMTGMILAMARGAGEVAPLMLVGAVKLAPELPLDGVFPYLHPERSFMHLGFHIYDQAFQSQNSEAARPLVFTTTLLLIVIVTVMNLAATWLRSRLRQRFEGNQF